MDPNTALDKLRAALSRTEALANGDSNDAEIKNLQEVEEHARALDEWLTNGGFLPEAWRR